MHDGALAERTWGGGGGGCRARGPIQGAVPSPEAEAGWRGALGRFFLFSFLSLVLMNIFIQERNYLHEATFR